MRCRLALALGCASLTGAVLAAGPATAAPPVKAAGTYRSATTTTTATATTGWTYVRATAPDRTLVKGADGALLATLTDRSRTVVLAGPARTFAEPATTTATVRTTAWVRLLPSAFAGTVDAAWLTTALADRTPDLLAVAAQYATGATTVLGADGSVLAADASYGPLVDGQRQEGSDWNDFLQVPAVYDGVVDAPEPAQVRSLDCSGLVRMVFGRRLGHAMVLAPDGVRLPRRATSMHTAGPGRSSAARPRA